LPKEPGIGLYPKDLASEAVFVYLKSPARLIAKEVPFVSETESANRFLTPFRRLIQEERITVTFERRSHNPVLREAALDRDQPPIPWLGNRRLVFAFR
jgi:hypothetical protein